MPIVDTKGIKVKNKKQTIRVYLGDIEFVRSICPKPGASYAEAIHHAVETLKGAVGRVKYLEGKLQQRAGNNPSEEESLAAGVIKEAQLKIKQREEETRRAREEAGRAREEVNMVITRQVEEAVNRLEQVQAAVKKDAGPSSLIEQAQKARDLLSTVTLNSGDGGSVQRELETMKLAHETAMKKMDLEMAKMNQDLQLRLAEFADNRRVKERGYEDSKASTAATWGAVADIARAAAAGFSSVKVKETKPERHFLFGLHLKW